MYQNKQSIFLVILLGLIIHKYYCKEQTYEHKPPKPLRFHVAEFNFEHVSDVYAITLWILLGSLAKVGKYLLIKIEFNLNIICSRFSFIPSFNRKIS